MNLAKLRQLLRQPICGLSGSVRHVDIPELRADLGLSVPAVDDGSKAERVTAAFNCTPDHELPKVAERYLASFRVPPAERNQIQDVLWEGLPSVRLVKKNRRAIAESLSPEDLFADAEQFDKLICKSDFVAVNAQVSRDSVRAAANVYLDRLAERLADFVDLGGWTLDGRGSAWVVATRQPSGEFKADAELELTQFALADREGKGLREPALKLKLSATGRAPDAIGAGDLPGE